jgi:hypothetical protein
MKNESLLCHDSRKPSADDTGTQLFLPLDLPIVIKAERPKKPVKPRGLKPTTVLCPRCLQFVFYLECNGRRCYQCRCGSALLGSRHRLNYRDPSPADWRIFLRGWSGDRYRAPAKKLNPGEPVMSETTQFECWESEGGLLEPEFFVPSGDWQSAPEGIIYPSGNGLHVRMNQTTRRTEVCWEKSAPNKNSDSLSALASDA